MRVSGRLSDSQQREVSGKSGAVYATLKGDLCGLRILEEGVGRRSPEV